MSDAISGSGIVLVGLPGSGKTSVGRCLAQRLGRPFVDLDERVQERTGASAAEHTERGGEAAFRAVERDAVATLDAPPEAIIATGGGTVIDPLNRWDLTARGVLVHLAVQPRDLVDRLAADLIPRPMYRVDTARVLEAKAVERAPFYRAADLVVDGSGPAERVADAVLAGIDPRSHSGRSTWRAMFDALVTRRHPIGPAEGRVVLGRGLDATALSRMLHEAFPGRVPAIVADRRIVRALPALDAALPDGRRLMVTGGERAKRMRGVERVLEWLRAAGVERGDPLVAVGGGTVGDLAGVAASLYLRGIPLVHLPTTWLAQADSALGGKVAVDLASAKNAAGAFWPAWSVIADIEHIRALPLARRRDGIAECLKAGLIGDAVLWELVERQGLAALSGEDEGVRYAITERAARSKLAIVERDPFDHGERRTLNLGHTLGHALEVASGYSMPHGAAVALGLRAVAAMAEGRGAEPGLAARIDDVLARLGFSLHARFDPAVVRSALGSDKKRDRGRLRWILPMAVGRVTEVDDVSETELAHAMATISAP